MAGQLGNVLLTGANRGLGLEMVKQLLANPNSLRRLFACCRDPDGPRAQALQTLAAKHPKKLYVVALDATDLSSIKQCAQQVSAVVGTEGLNLLINNAGYLSRSTLEETTPEDMQHSFSTNVMGPLNIIKEFLPLLRAAAKASKISGMSSSKAAVINISTLLGSLEGVHQTYSIFTALPYRVSKAGLNMLTVCAAEELRKDEILFLTLHPGWVRTDMGGEDAEIEAPESVEGMLKVISSLTEKQNGAFLDYKGETVHW